MPIFSPNPNEPADKFIQRCMSDEVMLSEYPDQAQRFAICSVTFDKEKIESKSKINNKNENIKRK
jgi:hypothetical protein